jgi:MerR family transcriptional regulator, redox-sensitive transcriptional activator SoxR
LVEVFMDDHELTPGELADRSGVAISALHFYERQGLISSRRTSGNQRRYSRETLRRVAFIRMSQRLGIPLARVCEALATLPADRVPTSKDWARLSAGWRQDLDDRIVHLQRLRDNLADCIGCGCLSLKSCTLSNPGDILAGQGPGPVRLQKSSNKRAIHWRGDGRGTGRALRAVPSPLAR